MQETILVSVAAHIHKFLPLRDIESLYALNTYMARQPTTFVYRQRTRSFLRRMEKIGAYHLRRQTIFTPAFWENHLLETRRLLERLEPLRIGTLGLFEKLKTINDW
ncbi:hypothetical protein EBZ80_02020 [bacterium]|nr:hypothetical protein [bacterium]